MGDAPSMESYLTGRDPAAQKKPPSGSKQFPEWLMTSLVVVLLLAVAYLLYDGYASQKKTQAELARLDEQIKALQGHAQTGAAKLTDLEGKISETRQQVGDTKAEVLKKTAQQIQSETSRTKSELSQAIATKADASQVQEVRKETDAKIGQVSSEVGVVKEDLAGTKRDLEGTQRQLIDVKETLTAAVAKNAAELNVLRRKGERDYFEFEIPKKNQLTKVEDIRLILTKTDPKKGKYSVQIVVDDNKLEKKDRNINEPLQFLVGRDRLRYEVVVNWVQKNSAGGYLSIPKDKSLAVEHPAPTK
jgi:peptidoglycan hydrolase CwlO-like protein